MKKLLFALAVAAFGMSSCVKDGVYVGPPSISSVAIAPTAPTANVDVVVTAMISSSVELSSVQLYYKSGSGSYTTVNMTAGTVGATTPYTATIPASVNVNAAVISYYVSAVNKGGTTRTADQSYTVGAPPIDYASVVINELDGNTKFIELYNKSTAEVNISGMKLYKNAPDAGDLTNVGEWLAPVGAAGTTWEVPANTKIPAHGYFVVPVGGTNATTAVASATCVISSVIINNGLSAKQNLKIQLYKPDGTSLVDTFSRKKAGTEYGATITPDYGSGTKYSYARVPDGTGSFMLTAQSCGLTNTASQGAILAN